MAVDGISGEVFKGSGGTGPATAIGKTKVHVLTADLESYDITKDGQAIVRLKNGVIVNFQTDKLKEKKGYASSIFIENGYTALANIKAQEGSSILVQGTKGDDKIVVKDSEGVHIWPRTGNDFVAFLDSKRSQALLSGAEAGTVLGYNCYMSHQSDNLQIEHIPFGITYSKKPNEEAKPKDPPKKVEETKQTK